MTQTNETTPNCVNEERMVPWDHVKQTIKEFALEAAKNRYHELGGSRDDYWHPLHEYIDRLLEHNSKFQPVVGIRAENILADLEVGLIQAAAEECCQLKDDEEFLVRGARILNRIDIIATYYFSLDSVARQLLDRMDYAYNNLTSKLRNEFRERLEDNMSQDYSKPSA